MKLNQKVRYGVACLYELSKHPGELVDADHIASRQVIPGAYAQKILQALARGGLVLGIKGIGYKLIRPLDEISALDVIDVLANETEPASINNGMGVLFEKKINEALDNLTLNNLAA